MEGQSPQYKVKKRIIITFIFLLLIIIAFSMRLFWIQVIKSEEYRDKARDQRLRLLKVEPKRGIIYDSEGKELAVSAGSQTVVALPLEIENAEVTAGKLANILNMTYDRIYERLTKNASAVYVKRKIKEEDVNKIKNLDLKGITFTEESKRYYPKDNIAAHILGFAGIDNRGLEGLELSYDKYLRGTPGKIALERDAAGRMLPDGVREYIPPEDGFNIYLTIDEVIQYLVERELDKAVEEYEISGGTAIVMDPRDGSILALANRPTYNPNNFGKYPQEYWRNRAISDGFEPGSTFKIVTTASALEEGVVSENDFFSDPGYITVSGERIKCWKTAGHGRQTFKEVVQNSCNPGFVQVGMRIGRQSFYNYINAFGFGSETGIRLPGEADGILNPYDKMGPVELATISFGHGITVTPIQLITAVAAIANDGMLVKPRLVKEIRDSKGKLIEEKKPVPERKVVSTETARKTRELLENVVTEGTGSNAQIEGYRIGGKTGTASHYDQKVFDSSFIGMVPVDDPRLVILVVLYDVTGSVYYGSQTAAPVFRNITLDTLRYLEIPPRTPAAEKESSTAQIEVPDVSNIELDQARKIILKQGLSFKVAGKKERVVKQIPLPGAIVGYDSTVIVFTEDNSELEKKYYIAVPDLKGLSKQETAAFLKQLGLNYSFTGTGSVVSQNIEPGSRVPIGKIIEIKLRNNN